MDVQFLLSSLDYSNPNDQRVNCNYLNNKIEQKMSNKITISSFPILDYEPSIMKEIPLKFEVLCSNITATDIKFITGSHQVRSVRRG